MKIGIGLGEGPDASQAAVQALRQAKKTVKRPDLAFVFGSINLNQKEIHKAACQEVDPKVLIGGSSYAEITPAGVTKGSVAALFLSLDDAKVRFSTTSTGLDPYKTGLALIDKLPKAAALNNGLSLGFLLTALATGYEDGIFKSLAEGLGPVPIFGGMSSGNYDLGFNHKDFWTSYQYPGEHLTRGSAKLALLEFPREDFRLGFASEHGWEPVGPILELTKCKGNRVYEIGGIPVLDYYRQFLGDDHSNKFFDLMIQRYAFSLVRDEAASSRSLLKLPVACNFEEGWISYYPAEDLQGRKVRLIQTNRRAMVQGTTEAAKRALQALDGAPPALVFVVSCCTRNLILHSQMNLELEAVRNVFGKEIPIFGYYSGGEIAPLLNLHKEISDIKRPLSGSYYHTMTVGILAIGSKKNAAVRNLSTHLSEKPLKASSEVARLKEMLAKSEEVLDSTEGFLANLSRKLYRDSEQLRKQNEVIYRYTPHDVWKEVGTSVAHGQYELPDADFAGCFMFLDVKGFTPYSEDHGPKEVVAALNGIFGPATEIIYRCEGDVDKFIGDCIFAVFRKSENALKAGREILLLVKSLSVSDNPFMVRIGLNMGRAIRANVGAKDRREYTYIGDDVNLAQRLESNCTPGRLLVSKNLFEQTKTLFTNVERKEIQVKGKKLPIIAYECSL